MHSLGHQLSSAPVEANSSPQADVWKWGFAYVLKCSHYSICPGKQMEWCNNQAISSMNFPLHHFDLETCIPYVPFHAAFELFVVQSELFMVSFNMAHTWTYIVYSFFSNSHTSSAIQWMVSYIECACRTQHSIHWSHKILTWGAETAHSTCWHADKPTHSTL